MRTLSCWFLIVAGWAVFAGCKTMDRSSQLAAVEAPLDVDPAYEPEGGSSPVSNFGKVNPLLFRGSTLR